MSSEQDQLRAVAAMENMLKCNRRGLCLLREWMRRYGEPGSSCMCFYRFSECISDSPTSSDDLGDVPY